MMQKHWKSFVVMAMSSAAILSADVCLSDCSSNWEITGEYLYLKPTTEDNYFVIKSDNPSLRYNNGTKINSNFDYQNGFRLGLAYNAPEQYKKISVYYTQLNSSSHKTVEGETLSATAGPAMLDGSTYFDDDETFFNNYSGSADANLNVRYQRGDVWLTQTVYNCHGLILDVLAGVEIAKIKDRRIFNYNAVSEVIDENRFGVYNDTSKTEGVGPEVGLKLSYDLLSNCAKVGGDLRFNVHASGSLLVASSDSRGFAYSAPTNNSSINQTNYLNVRNKRTWRVIPALHGRVGLNYATRLGCFDGSFEIGYEVSNYLRALFSTGYPDVNDDNDYVALALSKNRYSNFGLQGLYISANFSF